jgi:hypothetical protein
LFSLRLIQWPPEILCKRLFISLSHEINWKTRPTQVIKWRRRSYTCT